MATKTVKIAKKVTKVQRVDEVTKVLPKIDFDKIRMAVVVILIAAGLGLFWWKTNSWPVVALVNGMPVTRFEVNRQLYAQGGAQVLDGIVTQKLIQSELSKKKISISETDITSKLTEIQTQLGTDITVEQALSMQGMTLSQFKNQLKVQMGLEKLVEPTTDSAKLRQEMMDLVQNLKDKAKIWILK